jgi:hypothetical protein
LEAGLENAGGAAVDYELLKEHRALLFGGVSPAAIWVAQIKGRLGGELSQDLRGNVARRDNEATAGIDAGEDGDWLRGGGAGSEECSEEERDERAHG